MAARQKEQTIDVVEIQTERMDFCILGRTPLILNRVKASSMGELLVGGRRKNAAEKRSSVKHDPLSEYRESPYRAASDDRTLLAVLATWFKRCLAGAALDLPGVTKTEVGRMCWAEGERLPVYGPPQMLMSITRSADAKRTPDVRTRCILPVWATRVSITYARGLITGRSVANLLAAGGITNGVGDWRPQKGSGNYGQFELVGPDDERFVEIVAKYGREHQESALADPVCYDAQTEGLWEWYQAEMARRGITSTNTKEVA